MPFATGTDPFVGREREIADLTAALDGAMEGRGGLVMLVGFPDVYVTVDDLVAEEDKVVIRWTLRGAHTGEFHGISPTGKPVTITLLEEMRIAAGLLAEAWGSFDGLRACTETSRKG